MKSDSEVIELNTYCYINLVLRLRPSGMSLKVMFSNLSWGK